MCVSVFVCGAHKSVGNLVGEFILFRPFRPYDFCVLFVSVKYFGNSIQNDPIFEHFAWVLGKSFMMTLVDLEQRL